jgi:hypothetical protein
MLVKNDGDKITVKTKKSEQETSVKQISSELVAINTNSDKINIVEDGEVMLNFMEKNNISATFTLSTEKVEWPEIKREDKNKLVAMQIEKKNKQLTQDIKIEENKVQTEENVVIVPEEKDPLLEGIKEVISSEKKETLTIDENITSQL